MAPDGGQNGQGEVATGAMSGNRRKCERKEDLTGIQTIKENKQKVDTNTIDYQGQERENPARQGKNKTEVDKILQRTV